MTMAAMEKKHHADEQRKLQSWRPPKWTIQINIRQTLSYEDHTMLVEYNAS